MAALLKAGSGVYMNILWGNAFSGFKQTLGVASFGYLFPSPTSTQICVVLYYKKLPELRNSIDQPNSNKKKTKLGYQRKHAKTEENADQPSSNMLRPSVQQQASERLRTSPHKSTSVIICSFEP